MAITAPIMLDSTGQTIAGELARQNLLLAQMVTPGEATSAAELQEIHRIVQSGEAPNTFTIGDQIMLNYNDGTNSYVLPWDIVHFGTVTLQDGETVPGMFIQSHYAMQALQFDAKEAFYTVPNAGMAAGTYNFTLPSDYGSAATGKWQFTVPSVLAAGTRLVFQTTIYDSGLNNAVIAAYTNPTDSAPVATMTVTAGNTGTSLGNLENGTIGELNNIACAVYGNNNWAQSGIRQFLNSSAAINTWWTAQNDFDMPPTQLTSLPGFMSGFDQALLNIIKPVQVNTALNTIAYDGSTVTTYDTFFPASLEQEYIRPQASGVEGAYWEYWKQRLGLSSPQATGAGGTNAAHIRYSYSNKTSAQTVRLRSAYRSGAVSAWHVHTAGSAYYYNGYAVSAYRPAPACVIC